MNIRADIPLIEMVSNELRDMLGEEFDQDTFLDTLDGETDALEIFDAVLASMQEDNALAAAIKQRESDLADRRKRMEARAKAKKRTLLTILNATGETKLERPLATVSRRKGSLSLRVNDEASIPSQLTTTIVKPDTQAIRKQIEAGEDVPGAELVRGDDSVTVRVK